MSSYRNTRGKNPDFRVRYRFLSAADGGRQTLPLQHLRCDFLYDDDAASDSIWMIWPEFLSVNGDALADGEQVLAVGFADMFILNDDMREAHRRRLRLGTCGYFVEGPRKIASCEVAELLEIARVEP